MTQIQLRRNTAAFFSFTNPVLASGEPAFALDANILKIGDGVTAWNSLSGISAGLTQADLDNAISNLIDSAPETLDTLNEIAAAINDNPDFFQTVAYSGGNISQFNNNTGYLVNVVEDTTPQLGGDLDINTNNITGTGNISIVGDIIAISGTLDVLSFNVNNESTLTKGQISWDDTEGTMDIGLTENSTIHIGEHRYFRIRNQTGSPLYKGQVVYATGVHSNGLITPAKYVADGSVREVRFMGVVLENVNNNNNGYVIDFGHLHDMDLDGSATNYAVGDETWLAGDILYVHPTVPGKLTKVEPQHSIVVAIILDAGNGNGNGQMFVRPTSYGHLDDNHDVSISSPQNGQTLVYNSGTGLWENVTPIGSEGSGISSLIEDTSPQLGGNLDLNSNDITGVGNIDITGNIFSNNDQVLVSGDNVSLLTNDVGYLTSHPVISAASSSDNSGRTYIQDILLDSNGHVTGLTTATETVTDTDTTYTAGSGLNLIGTEFSTVLGLNNLIGVTLTSIANNDVLAYNSGTGLWENSDKVLFSDNTSIPNSSGVRNLVVISSGNYDALGSYDPNTLYFIT